MSAVKLHYKTFGSGQPLIILHGLMGMLDNWLTHAKQLENSYQVILVDQRNHGHSPHVDEMSYAAMSEDLLGLIDDLGLSNILLVGHSMGGKTAMKFAQHHADLLEKLVVVDIAPRYYPPHHQQIFEAINAVDLDFVKSRNDAAKIMRNYLSEEGVIQFLLKNMYWVEKDQLGWRFNLPVLEKRIESVGEMNMDSMVETPTLFIAGGNSKYIQEKDVELINTIFPNNTIEVIENAGHWVHAEQPKAFLDCLLSFLQNDYK